MCLTELQAFAEEMGEDVCLRAIDIALDAKKANWNYIRGILRNAKQQGVKCLSDFEALQDKHDAAKMKKAGKLERSSYDKETLSDVERRAVERLIGGANNG